MGRRLDASLRRTTYSTGRALTQRKNPHTSQILTLTQNIRSSKLLLILKGSFFPPTTQKVTGIYQPKVFF